MKKWFFATLVVLACLEATPWAQSFNQQIQAALTAMGWASSTSSFSVWVKSFGWPAGSYLNFGSTLGANGYGFRDNAGQLQFRNSGGSWSAFPTGGAASSLAKYIVQQPDASIPNAQALSALATGIVLNTTATGVLSTSLLLPAANFPALTGPITTPGGSLVTTITNAAVTLAKIQNATANSKLLGSGAAGIGTSYVELTLGSGLSMSGNTLSSTAAAVATGGGAGCIQYNTAGAFDCSANLIWTNGSSLLTVTGTTKTTSALIGNNSPSLTSPVNVAMALSQLYNTSYGAAQEDGASLTTMWNPGANVTGQSEGVLLRTFFQGTHSSSNDLYGLHIHGESQGSGTLSKFEAERAEAYITTGSSTVSELVGYGGVVHADHGTASDARVFYAYAPEVGGSGAITRGVEFYGADPYSQSCTTCMSQYLDFSARGQFVVAPTPATAIAWGLAPYTMALQNTISSNADLGGGFAGFFNQNADVTPSADWGNVINAGSVYMTIRGTHVMSAAQLGLFGGIGTSGSTSYTDASSTGVVGAQFGLDYGSSGAALKAGSAQLYIGDSGAGVITNGYELEFQSPYDTTGIVTNYAALLIQDQTWPGSTTNFAIKYNAPASKTFAVSANGDTTFGGAKMTWPAANATGVLTNDGSGGLSWSTTALFPLRAPAGTSTAPSFSWTTATGVGLYQASLNQTGIVGGTIFGKTASAANGSIIYVPGTGVAATAGNPLIQINLNPGFDAAQTIPTGQNGTGLLMSPVFTTAGGGTHALVANVNLGAGTWTAGGAVVTEGTTLYIAAAPSIGVNKYALHVAAGYSRFDGGSGEQVLTVGTLPGAPVVGQRAAVSDANAPAVGSAVAGGGAAFAAVMWNGAQWTVYSK